MNMEPNFNTVMENLGFNDIEFVNISGFGISFKTSSDIKIARIQKRVGLIVNGRRYNHHDISKYVYIIAEDPVGVPHKASKMTCGCNVYKLPLDTMANKLVIFSKDVKKYEKITMNCHLMIHADDVRYHLSGKNFQHTVRFMPLDKNVIVHL